MGIQTKNILIDDVDVPNQHQGIVKPDYRYTEYNPVSKKRKEHGYISFILLAIITACGLISFARIVPYFLAVNAKTETIDVIAIALIKIALTLCIIVGLFQAVLWGFAKIAHASIIRLPNNMPMSIVELFLTRQTTFIHHTMDQYYKERQTWATHSDMWGVQTLDLSQSTRAQLPPPVLDVKDDAPLLGKHQNMLEMMIDKGLIDRSGNSLLVGFHDKKPAYIELNETGMIALAGQPRTGKTSTALSLIAQVLLMHESQLIVCDKHGHKADSLLTRLDTIKQYLYRSAIAIEDIIAAIDLWYEIGSNRLAEDSNRQYPVCMIVIDEFTALILLNMLPPASVAKLLTGAVEFPKVQAHGLIIGHQWTGKLLGGTLGAPLRRVTTQRIIHRIDPTDAGFLINAAHAKHVSSLETGKALYMGASQPTPLELMVPYLMPDDLRYLARMLARNSLPSLPSQASATPIDDRTTADLSNGERMALARVLLARKSTTGYTHTQEQVRAICGLRTATIVELSRSIGRSK